MSLLLLIACLFFNIISAGIFWLLQIVHYPLLRRIGPKDFNDYFKLQSKQEIYFTWFIPTLALLLAISMVLFPIWGLEARDLYIVVILCLVNLLATVLLVRPQLNILASHGYSYVVIKKLVKVNWIRTIGWTLNSLFLLYVLLIYIERLRD